MTELPKLRTVGAQQVAEHALSAGFPVTCATCEHLKAAWECDAENCGKLLTCGGPIFGRCFPDYVGPLTKEAMDWFRRQYVPKQEVRRDPYVSPLLAKDHSNLPPAVVITAQFDPLRDEGEAYAKRLEQAGVSVEFVRFDGMLHGFVTFVGFMDQAADAIDLIAAKVKEAN